MNVLRKQKKGWFVVYFVSGEWHWCYQMPGGTLQQGTTLLALPDVTQAEILLLLPGDRVPLISIMQPGLTPSAAPWVLEPLLLEDIETQHIVILRHKDEQYTMAAVDRLWLTELLGILAGAGITPQRVLPDALALAPGTRLRIGEQWLLRLTDGSSLQLPVCALEHFPALHLLEEVNEDPLRLLADRARAEMGNMLQGPFAVKRSVHRPLVASGIAAILGITSIIGLPLWEGWQAKRALTQLNQLVLVRYHLYFPQENPVDPRRQFSRKAVQSEENQGGMTFITLLHQSQGALDTMKINPVQTLSWAMRNSQLTLQFRDAVASNLESHLPATLRAEIRGKQLKLEKRP